MKRHQFFAALGWVMFVVGTLVALTNGDPTRFYSLAACNFCLAIYERMGELR